MNRAIPIPVNAKITWGKIVRNWQLYVMIAPAVILIFILCLFGLWGMLVRRLFNPALSGLLE